MTNRPFLIADIAELVLLLTLEAGAVTAFVGMAALWCAVLGGM
jgi:hypothetical protein